MKKIFKIAKYFVFFLTLTSFILAPFIVRADTKKLNILDPNIIVCEALGRIGMGCGVFQTTSNTTTPTPSPILNGNVNGDLNLTAAIYNSGSNRNRRDVVLVRATGQNKVYEIVGGQKHYITTRDIFYDYGFKDELIQNITPEELNRYPR